MPEKELTTERSLADFKRAYRAKKKLIERQKEDFLFRLGKQWTPEKEQKLKERGIEPITDNRIQPNIFLLTGLERQNRSDFKAFPEGDEDSIKAEIATALFKNSVKMSDFGYKASEAFEDGVTCGESALELYLDNTFNILNGKPCWKKIDSNKVFPEPGFKEYDYSDARFIYKLTTGLSEDDLISIYPEKEELITKSNGGTINLAGIDGDEENYNQKKDYPKTGESAGIDEKSDAKEFDLIERYYKKWVKKYFVGDRKTGEIVEAENEDKATSFITEYQMGIIKERMDYDMSVNARMMDPLLPEPITPEPRDIERFKIIPRNVPEVWYFAHVPGMKDPLADEKAWFYPKWKGWPIIPYFAHFSTAPIDGDDRHLLVQGLVHGVKGAQSLHNSSETLMLLHLNGAANSGWISEEDSWLDPSKVEKFGATPNVNLEYKTGKTKPERIFPMTLSPGHLQSAERSAEAIKSILGINADLLAAHDGGQSSGRAIALRQRQGLLMVQKLFDNLSRTKQIAGKFLLSQLGEMYDTETAKKVLGDAFLKKNFPPLELLNEQTGQPEPMKGSDGQPMEYDADLAEVAISEVLSGDLGQYDVAVGEAVASETMKLANAAELNELAQKMPGLIPPDLLVEESQLNNTTKNRILGAIKNAQAASGPTPGSVPLGIA